MFSEIIYMCALYKSLSVCGCCLWLWEKFSHTSCKSDENPFLHSFLGVLSADLQKVWEIFLTGPYKKGSKFLILYWNLCVILCLKKDNQTTITAAWHRSRVWRISGGIIYRRLGNYASRSRYRTHWAAMFSFMK